MGKNHKKCDIKWVGKGVGKIMSKQSILLKSWKSLHSLIISREKALELYWKGLLGRYDEETTSRAYWWATACREVMLNGFRIYPGDDI